MTARDQADVWTLGTVVSHRWNWIGLTDESSGWALNDLPGNAASPLDARPSPCQDRGGPGWPVGPLANSPPRANGRSEVAAGESRTFSRIRSLRRP